MNITLDLNTIWFALVGILFTGYAILDGFDLTLDDIECLLYSFDLENIGPPLKYIVQLIIEFAVGFDEMFRKVGLESGSSGELGNPGQG